MKLALAKTSGRALMIILSLVIASAICLLTVGDIKKLVTGRSSTAEVDGPPKIHYVTIKKGTKVSQWDIGGESDGLLYEGDGAFNFKVFREGSNTFKCTFRYVVKGKRFEETIVFDKTNISKWRNLPDLPEDFKVTVSPISYSQSDQPGVAAVKNLPALDRTTINKEGHLPSPASGSQVDTAYVFLVFSQPEAGKAGANDTWVKPFADKVSGSFDLQAARKLDYVVTPKAEDSSFEVSITVDSKTKAVKILQKELGLWKELGEKPEDNLACMILRGKEFNEQVLVTGYPPETPAMLAVRPEVAALVKPSDWLDKIKAAGGTRIMVMSRETATNDGASYYAYVLHELTENDARANAVDAWKVKLRPRTLPEMYVGKKRYVNPKDIVDVFYFKDGQLQGNYISKALKPAAAVPAPAPAPAK